MQQGVGVQQDDRLGSVGKIQVVWGDGLPGDVDGGWIDSRRENIFSLHSPQTYLPSVGPQPLLWMFLVQPAPWSPGPGQWGPAGWCGVGCGLGCVVWGQGGGVATGGSSVIQQGQWGYLSVMFKI